MSDNVIENWGPLDPRHLTDEQLTGLMATTHGAAFQRLHAEYEARRSGIAPACSLCGDTGLIGPVHDLFACGCPRGR